MGFDKSGKYSFKTLETKYSGFISPAFEIKVGSYKLDSVKVPVSSLTVQLTTQNKAGVCNFTIEALYDYETSKWADGFFDKVDVGMTVEVQAGYADSKKRIFYGFVQEFTVEYNSETAPQLSVTAMDGLALMMNNKEEKDFGEMSTKDVVTELFGACLDEGVVESTDIGDVPAFQGKFVKDKKSSDYDFLCRLAEMCFMSFCVIDGELLFKNFFENSKPVTELQMGVSLHAFRKTQGVRSDVTGSVKVISTGTPDHTAIIGKADAPSGYDEGKTPEEKWTALSGTEKEVHMNFLKTPEECETVAQNILDALCLGFVRASGTCVGMPEIIPGRFIALKGMDEKSNGSYFITDVTHSYSGNGYITTFETKGFRSK